MIQSMQKGIVYLMMLGFFSSAFLYAAEGHYPTSIDELTNKQALTILGLSTDKLKRADLQTKEMQKEIDVAYKKLAKQYHPDKTGGDERVFKNISAAKERLTQLDTVKLHEEEEGLCFNAFDGLFGAGFGRSSHGPRSSHFTRDDFGFFHSDIPPGFSSFSTRGSDFRFEDMYKDSGSFFAHSSSTSSQESKQQKSSKQQRNDFNVASSKKDSNTSIFFGLASVVILISGCIMYKRYKDLEEAKMRKAAIWKKISMISNKDAVSS